MRGLERVARDRRHLVAAQVRCSTGFTTGHAVDGIGRLRAAGVWAGPAIRAAMLPPVVVLPSPEPGARRSNAAALLAVLEVWPEGEPLGTLTEMAHRAGFGRDASSSSAYHASNALDLLIADRALVMTVGTRQAWHGERALLLRASGRLLATVRAPSFWAKRMREMASA